MSDNKLVEGLGDVNLNDKEETEVVLLQYRRIDRFIDH